MRLWSIHPKYLDTQGLLACWREALLAQKVILGKTKGYRNHPQLLRFKKRKDSLALIGKYLYYLYQEAGSRGYVFNAQKIFFTAKKRVKPLCVTRGQLSFEFEHLRSKLKKRDPQRYAASSKVKTILPCPLFKVCAGKIEEWEKTKQ